MKKLAEILFLSNLNRVGKATIYGKYWNMVNELDLDDLLTDMEYKTKFSYDELMDAREKAEMSYESVINNPNIDVITVFDDEYPNQLNIMGNKKPLFLYVEGNLDALSKPNIAIIGTRNPSEISQEFEYNLVRTIVHETDRVVVSGLALGCDKIAHQTTIDENKITIAVLPSGFNVIKPTQHRELARDIIDKGGCLISEYEPNVIAQKYTYIERDQIVAAFSDATFVIECGVKSGTMHTVNFACEYNKPIFAYLPDNKQNIPFDGNEYILENKCNSVKVNNISKFCRDLENLDIKNYDSESKQQILKFSKKSGQTTFDF